MIVTQHYIADTRSGKKIYAHETEDVGYLESQTSDHDSHDSFDAYWAFEFMLIRALRLYGEHTKIFDIMLRMSRFHLGKMSTAFFIREKSSLALVTSIDLRKYGKRLCKPFFDE